MNEWAAYLLASLVERRRRVEREKGYTRVKNSRQSRDKKYKYQKDRDAKQERGPTGFLWDTNQQ